MTTQSVRWGKGREEQCRQWLDAELRAAQAARSNLEAVWRRWLEQYRAPAIQPVKSFPFEGACLARDTEILTLGGWRLITDVRIGEQVLTRRDDGVLEWQSVTALPEQYAEKLYHFKSRSINLMVTGNHVMLAEHQDKPGRTIRMNASDLWGKTGYYLPQHGSWLEGKPTETLWGRPAGAIAEFVGWFLAEGSSSETVLRVSQSRDANYEKCRRLETTFQRCGFTWTYSGHDYLVHKSTIPVALFDLLRGVGGASRKRVPSVCWNWSAGLLNDLLTGMVLGDGNIFDAYPMDTVPKVNYYTISAGLADDVQAICALVSLHARVRSRERVNAGGVVGERQIRGKSRCHEVAICSVPRAKYDRAFSEIVDYHDTAYCVTVENHAIYVRRRGIANWTGNSNYVLPITATDVDQLYAKEMQTIFAPDNLWTFEALNEDWVAAAKPLQDGMEWLDRNLLHMWDVCKRVKLEKFKLGTGIYKTGWLYESRPVWTYNPAGQRIRAQKKVGRPFVDHVRLPDFLMPPYSYAIQSDHQGGAPWVAERLRIDVDRFRSLARASEPFLPGISIDAVNAILKFLEPTDTDHDTKIQDLDFVKRGTDASLTDEAFDTDKSTSGSTGSIRRSMPREIELWEIHARFPTGGQGGADDPSRNIQEGDDSQDDVVLWYHQPTYQFVRAVYGMYDHGKRPYDVERMFPGDGFYGIGVCEQKEMFQKAQSELINFTFDNVLLGNSIGIAAKAGANIAPGEPVYPGKIWITEGEPQKEFHTFQLGTTYPNLTVLQQMMAQLGERRTGISDLQLGNMQQLPGRTPATTMLTLLQEGNRRPDFAIKDSRYEGLAVVGLRIMQMLQQFIGTPQDVGGKQLLRLMVKSLGMPEGLDAAQKLATPMESAELGLGVSITATSGSANKEVERQNRVALLQLAAQITPQFIQLASVAMQSPDTLVGKIALESMVGLRNLYQGTLEQYDVRNIEDVAPDIQKDVDEFAAQSQGQGGTPPGPLAGAGGLVGPTGGTPQLQGVLQALGIGG